jgi:hypothetical protein
MSELQTEAAPAAAETAAIVNDDIGAIEKTMAEAYDRLNPPRENGKFAAKEVKAEAETTETEGAEPSEPEAQVSDQEPVAEAKEPAPPAIQRPQAWSSDVDELWSKLPPAAQELISKREGEAHKRITELGEVAKTVEPIKPYLEPLQRASARMGVSPGKGLELLLAADDYLARDPVQAIQWLAQQSGVDLSRFGQQPTGEVSESAEVNALNQKISQLVRMLSETSHRIQSREQQEQQAQAQSLENLVQDFAKGKDYWPEIEAEVAAQIAAIRLSDPSLSPKDTLEKAHERAVKLNDDIRNKLNETKRKEEEAKKASEAKRKADEAKRLASLNVRSIEGKAPKPARKSLEEEMADVYERVASRA